MWLMSSLYTISQKTNTQLQYVSLLSEWKGLSASGRDVISNVSSLTGGKTFERFKKRVQKANDLKVNEVIAAETHVWWLDNYAHSIFRNIPSIKSTMFGHNLWTAAAIFTTDAAVSLDIVGRPKTCIPKDLKGLLPGPGNLQRMLHDLHDNRTLSQTLFARHNVSWVPIRPAKDYISKERLTRIIPIDIIKENIGSRDGLIAAVKYMQGLYDGRRGAKYSVGAVDTNIYWRLLKVPFLHEMLEL